MGYVTLFCDGASKGNPGPGACGFVIFDNKDKLISSGNRELGIITNNVAEYTGLIDGLSKCKELGASTVLVYTDSELVVKQLNGAYEVRSPKLKPLWEEVQELLKEFEAVTITHISREFTTLADIEANKALK